MLLALNRNLYQNATPEKQTPKWPNPEETRTKHWTNPKYHKYPKLIGSNPETLKNSNP
jgi:hypothetical protein